MAQSLPELSLLETRVLGTLYEKQHTVPDSYPLTLNAIVAGCNQKSSRSPVMEAAETEVQAAIDSLKHLNLAMETSGGRVSRYSHNLERVLQVPSQSAAILASLMLRGPQTAGELRQRCERIHRFAGGEDAEEALEALIERRLVTRLPRRPGERGQRYEHLLAGDAEGEPGPSESQPAPPEQRPASAVAPAADGLEPRVAGLESEVARLRDELGALHDELGALRRELGG
jgi:uncharacterized protein YceH (UPF0502 family)